MIFCITTVTVPKMALYGNRAEIESKDRTLDACAQESP